MHSWISMIGNDWVGEKKQKSQKTAPEHMPELFSKDLTALDCATITALKSENSIDYPQVPHVTSQNNEA